MLQKLHILNYAIIDEIEINFSHQLNIITGETGAGKSILMGALSLILGERADTSVLLKNDKKCFIEGTFLIQGKAPVFDFLKSNDLDEQDELVLRREISSAGKSRAFINDTPATLQQLKELASLLVDLHQQFDTLQLGDSDFQREVLDALGSNAERLQSYQTVYRQLQQTRRQLEELLQQKAAFTKEQDYHQFIFNELQEAGLKENELEELDHELQLLNNSEGIKSALSKVYYALKESEQPVVALLKQLSQQLQPYGDVHPQIQQLVERLQSSQIELQDIAGEAEHVNDAIGFDEKRIEWINEKLATGYKLLKKHNVQTTNELLQIQQEVEQKLQAVLNMDDNIQSLQRKTDELLKEAEQLAKAISLQREKQVIPLTEKVNTLLVQVGMPNARIKVMISPVSLNEFGQDEIEFLFDANKSNRFEPLRKVASGGELSRLMLCIKSLVAQSVDLPTMIFDEIDTGISGEAAKQVGLILQQLAATRQIICITHQPQIAGKANAHYFVYKHIKDDAVKTNIRLLNRDERITAIAKMLSGEQPSAAALESAKEMMN